MPRLRHWSTPRTKKVCVTSIPRRSTAMVAANCGWAPHSAQSLETSTYCRPRSVESLHAMKPGEKRPADFREKGLPDFVPVFDDTYDGVMRSLKHSHFEARLARI